MASLVGDRVPRPPPDGPETRPMAAADADRNLLFGLRCPPERPDQPGPARRRVPGVDPATRPVPGRPPRQPRRPRRRPSAACRGDGGLTQEPRRRRREEPRRVPGRPARPARAWPDRRPRTRRARSAISARGSTRRRADADRTATYSVGTATSRRPAVPHPPAPRPGRAGRGLRGARTGAATARWPSRRSRTSTPTIRTSRARFLLEAEITGGLEHPGIVPVYGLGTYADGRPFLRDAVHPGRQPQGGDRALPRRRDAPRRDPGRAVAGSCASCCAGSSTSATRSPTPTAEACCTAT